MVCPHGRPRWCMAVHQHTDSFVGQPLCVECYDYIGHLVWQWHAPELWRRFTIGLRRLIARPSWSVRVGVPDAGAGPVREGGRVPTTRCGPLPCPDPARRSTDTRSAVPAAGRPADRRRCSPISWSGRPRRSPAKRHRSTAPMCRVGSGSARQLDARPVHDQADRDDTTGAGLHPETVAAYVAKYATKAAADLAAGDSGANPHLWRLKSVAAGLALRASLAGQTGPDGPYKGWGRWVDMLGFRGHFASKSRRYSTTLGRLRQARRDHTRRRHLEQRQPAAEWADRRPGARRARADAGGRVVAVRRHRLAHHR